MNISLSTGLYYKKNYTDILDIISKSGFQKIEVFINQAFMDVPHEDIKRAVDERGLIVESIHAPIRLFTQTETNEVELLEDCIKLAEILGTQYIVTHDIFERDEQGKVHYIDKDHFKAMEQFKNSNVVIMTENMPKTVSAESMMYDVDFMYEWIKKNDYKITYDVGHAATCGCDIIKVYELFKPYIRNIHLSDFKDGIEHRMLGEGELAIQEFLMHIKNDGYQYPMTIEYDFDNPKRNDIQSDEHAIKKLKMTKDFIDQILL